MVGSGVPSRKRRKRNRKKGKSAQHRGRGANSEEKEKKKKEGRDKRKTEGEGGEVTRGQPISFAFRRDCAAALFKDAPYGRATRL